MEQTKQESHDSPSKRHASSTSWGESLAGQPLNNTRVSSQIFVIHTLPAFMVFVSALLTLSFIILILSIFAGLSIGNTALHPNPFAAYEAVWPGQSIASVAAYALQIPQGYMSCISGASPLQPYSGLEVRVAAGAYDVLGKIINCMNTPNDDVFRRMIVTIDDDQVKELKLYSDVLQKDTLFLYWGAPDAIAKTGKNLQLDLYWERSTYSATASVLEHDSGVKLITLTARE